MTLLRELSWREGQKEILIKTTKTAGRKESLIKLKNESYIYKKKRIEKSIWNQDDIQTFNSTVGATTVASTIPCRSIGWWGSATVGRQFHYGHHTHFSLHHPIPSGRLAVRDVVAYAVINITSRRRHNKQNKRCLKRGPRQSAVTSIESRTRRAMDKRAFIAVWRLRTHHHYRHPRTNDTSIIKKERPDYKLSCPFLLSLFLCFLSFGFLLLRMVDVCLWWLASWLKVTIIIIIIINKRRKVRRGLWPFAKAVAWI